MPKIYKTSKPFVKVSKDEGNLIVNLHNSGKLISEICKILNRDKKTIRKFLYQILGRNIKNNRSPKLEISILDDIKERLLQGDTINKVSKDLGIGKFRVKKISKGLGIPNKIHISLDVNENYFEKIDTPNKAYFLGLIYADGSVSSSNNTLKLVLKASDVKLLESLRKELAMSKELIYDPPKKIGKTKYISSGSYSLEVYRKKIKEDLVRHGVNPNKTYNLKFPKDLDKNLYPHFIRGFFDGDGTINSINKSLTCTAGFIGTLEMLTKIKNILEIEGIYTRLVLEMRTKKLYYLYMHKRDSAFNFAEYMYKDASLFLQRKFDKFEEWKKLPYDKREAKERVNH